MLKFPSEQTAFETISANKKSPYAGVSTMVSSCVNSQLHIPKKPARCFLRRFNVRYIIQGSLIYQRVEGSLLYKDEPPVNFSKYSFFRNPTEIISVTAVAIFSEKVRLQLS